jgi:predicted DsbA family dithiol-disulfide isomerase
VATVNGETITEAQLDAVTRKQIEALEEQVRRVRQMTLQKLIDNLLLEQAARAEGIPVEAYLRKHVESVEVSQEDVESAYHRSSGQFAGILPGEAKYRIRRSLEDNRRADALRSILDDLRSRARVSNRLLEDRLAPLERAGSEGPFAGAPRGPVTVIEFSDFECPFCRQARPFLKRILEKWPDQVRLVFKQFPLDQHANAFAAATAAVCAARQDRFWPFHDLAFREGQDFSRPGLLRIGAALRLSMTEFQECLDSPAAAEQVRKDIALGRSAGVSGTPAFFVNGQQVRSAADLETVIGKLLSQSPQGNTEVGQ